MVAVDTLPFLEPDARVERTAEAQDYLLLANAFLHPVQPVLIAIGGFSGTGKSTQAARIASDLGAAPGACVVRSDVERKKLFEVTPETHLDERAYTPNTSDRVYGQVRSETTAALRAGHTVITDAVFSDPLQRELIEQVATDINVPFVGLWLEAGDDVLLARVAQRTGDASDADIDVLRKQLTKDVGPITWHRIDASGPAEDVAMRVRQCLVDNHVLPMANASDVSC